MGFHNLYNMIGQYNIKTPSDTRWFRLNTGIVFMFCLLALGMRRLCLHLLTIFHSVPYFPFLLLPRTLRETRITTPWIKEHNEPWMSLDHRWSRLTEMG
jgi:hypothetical protein